MMEVSTHNTSYAPEHNAVFAIDPGFSTGWCWLRADGTFTTGVLFADWEECLRAMLIKASVERLTVAIEDVIDKSWVVRMLQPSQVGVVRRVTDIRLMVRSMGIEPMMVFPADWQRQMLHYGGFRATTKEASRRACQFLTGKRVRTAHESDAVLLAAYVSRGGM